MDWTEFSYVADTCAPTTRPLRCKQTDLVRVCFVEGPYPTVVRFSMPLRGPTRLATLQRIDSGLRIYEFKE